MFQSSDAARCGTCARVYTYPRPSRLLSSSPPPDFHRLHSALSLPFDVRAPRIFVSARYAVTRHGRYTPRRNFSKPADLGYFPNLPLPVWTRMWLEHKLFLREKERPRSSLPAVLSERSSRRKKTGLGGGRPRVVAPRIPEQ